MANEAVNMGTASSTGQVLGETRRVVSGPDEFGRSYDSSYQHAGRPADPGGYTGFTACTGFTEPGNVHSANVSHGSVHDYPAQQSHRLYPRLEEDEQWECFPQDDADVSNYDVSRDIVLSRVMAAEEFLQHMVEADTRIQVMSEVNDRPSVLDPLTEALGLRGHMQDELLRILGMLTAEDPNLSCLNDYEGDYPEVVNKLRDLGNKANALRTLSKTRAVSAFGARPDGVDLDPELADLDPSLRGKLEAQIEEVDIVAAQTENYPSPSRPEQVRITEEDLHVKHQVEMKLLDDIFLQEEQAMSSNFAERVLEQGPGSVDRLLQEHALSMQVLRDHQSMERHRVLTTVDEGPERMFQTTSHKGSTTPVQMDNHVQQIQKSYVAQIDFGADGTMSVLTPGEKMEKLTAPSGKKGVRPVGKAAVIRHEWKVAAEEAEDELRKSTSPAAYLDLDSDDDLNDLILSATTVQSSNSDDDFGDDEFDIDGCVEAETEELRSTFTKDMWEKRKEMTSEDFKAILSDYRSLEDERTRMRHSEKEKHQSSMLAKLAEKRKGTNSGQVSFDYVDTPECEVGVNDEAAVRGAEGGVNLEDFEGYLRDRDQEGEEAKRIRGGEHQRMNQKLKDKLKNKKNTAIDSVDDLTADMDEAVESTDAAFVADLRCRGMDEVDIDELLRRHLLDAEQIRCREFAEKSRLDERLREILGNNNKKDLEEMDDEVVKDLRALDTDLARRVRGRQGVTADDLDELLREHRWSQEALLQSRAAQRGRSDDRLKAKLQAARNLKESGETDEAVGDDQFFNRLQVLQKSGDMSQDAFQDMLRQYLSNVDGQRHNEAREQRRRLRAEEKLRESENKKAEQTACILVSEHQETTKKLHHTRQRQRQALDSKLKEKLKQSKIQKQAAEDPNDF